MSQLDNMVMFRSTVSQSVRVSGRVLGTGGESALQSERCSDLPASGRRLQHAHSQQHTSNDGSKAESGLPQEPGGVCGQCGRVAMCQITTVSSILFIVLDAPSFPPASLPLKEIFSSDVLSAMTNCGQS